MAQARTLSWIKPAEPEQAAPEPRRWLDSSVQAAQAAAAVPLPWQRGQRRGAIRARLRAAVEDAAQV